MDGPNATTPPGGDCEQYHAILFVPDVDEAVRFYTTRLGFWLAFADGQPATFAGLNLGRVQLFLERGEPSADGCALYFVVADVDKLYEFHRSRVEVIEEPGDREYHLRDYTVRDPYGYRLTFGHRLHPE